MEDKNLQDKINQSYEVKKSKKKNDNKILPTVLIIAGIIIAFFVFSNLNKNNNKSLDNNTKTQDKANDSSDVKDTKKEDENQTITTVDENGKEIKYKIQDTSKDKGDDKKTKEEKSTSGTAGLVKEESKNRPKKLNSDYTKYISNEDIDLGEYGIIENPRGAIGTEDEYIVMDKELNDTRNKYYDVNTGLKDKTKLYFESQEDGYIDYRYQDDKPNYVQITSESAESFISHEIEKKINPSYTGKKGEQYDIKDVNIDRYALSDEYGFMKNYYKVTYLAKTDEGKELRDSFEFTTTFNGGIVWKESEEN